MKKEILLVDNLKCGGCAANIERTLLKLNGVSKIKVVVEESKVEIYHDETTNRSVFINQLSKMGYPESGTSTLIQKGKSYVSCAIGKIIE